MNFSDSIDPYAFFLYSMFTGNFYEKEFPFGKKVSKIKYFQNILDGLRLSHVPETPDVYWELIEKIWNPCLDPSERPSFKEITEILKDDHFALNEFGMKTDLNELHAYQKRIDNEEEETTTKKVPLKEKKILKENEEMKKKIKDYESFFLIKSPHHQNDENCFIDDDEEEENYKLFGQVGEGATSITYKVFDERTKQSLSTKKTKHQ